MSNSKGGILMNLKDKNFALPVICTRGIVVFPHNEVSLDVGRKKSVESVTISQADFESFILVTSQKNPEIFDPKVDEIFDVGVIGRIKNIKKNDDGSKKVFIEALERVQLSDIVDNGDYVFASAKVISDELGDKNEEVALVRQLVKTVEEIGNINKLLPKHILNQLSQGLSALELGDMVANFLPVSLEKKQRILETFNLNQRLQMIIEGIEEEKLINSLENVINQKVRDKLESAQKEYVLREKLRVIKEELGDTPAKGDDSDDLRSQINNNPYPQNVKDKLLDELKRFEMTPAASAESSVIRNYIDWVMKVPWYQMSEDNSDLNKVEQVLNDDHYGLEKIKERILEYLAVKKLTSSLKAPIICFSGPPGTGKTSLAMSIARALNRNFVKASLGGVKDESEIRGHRRTYLGSMPGRIIQGMKKAGTLNPVFLLDEIDKLGIDYKGDPASALLEVLDPEQNKAFSDHYIEEPYNLSNVMFIATANYLENVPAPLRDRLEIIELSSYTELEKLEIAKRHLVAKQMEQNGLKPANIIFSDESLLHIIRYYTREAGVRNLEREIGAICRKAAVKMLKTNDFSSHEITISKVEEYLGKEKFDYTKKDKKDQVGVVMGLAYTQFGGDILPVEVTYFEGKGRINLTGNLGNIMKESANIALGYVKSNAKKYNIDPAMFENIDIHIHVPDGAVPKDGPSAGVTMTSAIISALSGIPAKANNAMTGEITLRGNVLPIGGLREKSISAHRSGLHKIYIPKENEKDIEDIPKSVREDLEIQLVSHIDEILADVLVREVTHATK